jgi:hypothetical protein
LEFLVYRDPKVFLQQGTQTDCRLSSQLRGNPCIEQATGRESVVAVEKAQIIIGIMQYDFNARLLEQATERGEVIHRQWVHQGSLRVGAELDQVHAVNIPVK